MGNNPTNADTPPALSLALWTHSRPAAVRPPAFWPFLPTALTLCGLGLGLGGVLALPYLGRAAPLLLASLACDALDGWAARRLGVVSRMGAALDWSSDVLIAYALAWALPWSAEARAVVALGLLGAQVRSFARPRTGGHLDRVSGRALVTLVTCVAPLIERITAAHAWGVVMSLGWAVVGAAVAGCARAWVLS